MKHTILAALAALTISIGAAHAQQTPAPAMSAFDATWCNG